MSGRSAYVRKEKTKVKDVGPMHVGSENGSIPDFPVAMSSAPIPSPIVSRQQYSQPQYNQPQYSPGDLATIKSGFSTNSDEQRGYARVQRPIVPMIVDSGIEKSSFRSLMDKKSEGVRKGLAKTFGKKKKEEIRPETSATIRPADQYELESGNYVDPTPYTSPPAYAKPRMPPSASSGYPDTEYSRPGTGPRTAPPQTKLPPIPQGPQMKRWIGGNRQVQPWNKLRKDPELWDPNGDTLIYFGRNDPYSPKPPPSFRISSHIIERTESRKLMILLRQGSTDEQSPNGFSMPPSPMSSPGTAPAYPVRHRNNYHQTPPISEDSSRGFEGQISYELFFEPEKDKSPAEIIRNQVTTRNFFALLSDKSLAGLNLFQTLNDLTERLEEWMPHDTDAAGMVIDYMVGKGFDDLRDNPSAAASILAWSELQNVWWDEGWLEGFVHCCGMYDRVELCSEFRFITSITRAHLERSACEMQVRIHDAAVRLSDFDFLDMWPNMSSPVPAARASFEKGRRFFLDFYRRTEGGWPPLPPPTDDQWLTRTWAQKLQTDFGALYDYLVDRVVVWDGSEERSSRKWNIVKRGDRGFDADTPDLPLTDLLVAFDNRHSFPHIPHPYCLVPEQRPSKNASSESLFRPSKKSAKLPDKMAETKARLAYTNSTNVFALGSNFPRNELVEEFTKFEKADFATGDPFSARRGHWVIIYGVLQVLASASVDSPNLRYHDGVSYHLSPKLRDTPPWKKGANPPEAAHTLSHCWLAVEQWDHQGSFNYEDKLPPLQTQPLMMTGTRRAPSSAGSEANSYKKSSFSPPSIIRGSKSRRNIRDSSEKSDNDTGRSSEQNPSTMGGNGNSYPSRGESMIIPTSRYTERQDHQTIGGRPYNSRPTEQQDSDSPPNTAQRRPSPPTYRPTRQSTLPASNTGYASRDPSATRQQGDGASNTGYAPGIEKVDDYAVGAWPIREESRYATSSSNGSTQPKSKSPSKTPNLAIDTTKLTPAPLAADDAKPTTTSRSRSPAYHAAGNSAETFDSRVLDEVLDLEEFKPTVPEKERGRLISGNVQKMRENLEVGKRKPGVVDRHFRIKDFDFE